MSIDSVIAANAAALAGNPKKHVGIIGRRLIPHIIDAYAGHEPSRIWAAQARTTNIEDGFQQITFMQLACCVDFMAWRMEAELGECREAFETIAYIGASDLRYAVVVWAGVKYGFQAEADRMKTLLPSTRNSESGNLSLLHDCKCTKLFCSIEYLASAQKLQQSKPDLRIHVVPALDAMLKAPAKKYPYIKTFDQAEHDPIICCHTSGSTGAPKPIQLTNHYFAAYDNHRKIPRLENRGRNVDYATFDTEDCAYFYNAFPPFHIAGIIAQGMIPILYNTTIVLGPVHRPPSGEICNDILKNVRIHSIYTPPTVLEQLLLEPGGLERAGHCNFIIFSGGPLAPAAGDQIAPLTNLGQYIGSTEIGIIPGILPSPESWRYFEFHPIFGCKLEHVSQDEYELVVPHDAALDWIRPAPYRIAPDKWQTNDIFKRHPNNEHAFRFHGRADDIIVLSNGEKFNPVTMEAIIQGAPSLSGALIVGQAKFQAALLVEPKQDTTTVSAQRALIEKIWPWVQKANEDGPAHAQLFRTKVLVTTPDRPMVRAGKGTVVRKKSTQLYDADIDALYSDKAVQRSGVRGLPDLRPPYSISGLVEFFCAYLRSLLSREVGPGDDFFVMGLDSLQTNQVVHELKSRLYAHAPQLGFITSKAVYHHPTAATLASFCYEHLSGDVRDPENASVKPSREQRMETMVQRYTKDLPRRNIDAHRRKRRKTDSVLEGVDTVAERRLNVVLTGSTGTLGTNILRVLLEDEKFGNVYCLDRSSEAKNRHARVLETSNLSHLLDHSRVTFLKAQLGQPNFGLEGDIFMQLVADVDVIIHNAWKVDFNHQLESFEKEHVRSVRHLVDWALQSERRVQIVFVSSLASVSRWSAHHPGTVPETAMDDYTVAQELGYGESKHVAERILQEAASRCGVNASVLRVGQIAGSTQAKGTTWNKAEWLPSLVQTSLALGCLPSSLPGVIDWIPVDVLARVVVDIAQSRRDEDRLQIYNLVNPHRTKWESLLGPLVASRSIGAPLRLIPFGQWTKLLGEVEVYDEQEVTRMPAAKIRHFYEAMERDDGVYGQFDTARAASASKTMSTLTPITEQMMEVWLEQWGY